MSISRSVKQENIKFVAPKVGGQNTLRPPTSKSGGTCPPVHPMIDAHVHCECCKLHTRKYTLTQTDRERDRQTDRSAADVAQTHTQTHSKYIGRK